MHKHGIKRPNFLQLLKEAGSEFIDDNAMKLSASLSYYTVFAIGPLLLVIISFTGLFVDRATVTSTINEQVQSLIGAEAANKRLDIISNLQKRNDSFKFSVIGIVILFFSASAVFLE